MQTKTPSGVGVVNKLFKTGAHVGMYQIKGVGFTLNAFGNDLKINSRCPQCGKGEVFLVKGRPPAHGDFARCDKCDTAFDIF